MFLIPPYSYNQLNHFALRTKSHHYSLMHLEEHSILYSAILHKSECKKTFSGLVLGLDFLTFVHWSSPLTPTGPFVRLSVKELTYTFRKFVMGEDRESYAPFKGRR